MDDFSQAFGLAVQMVFAWDGDLVEIVALSLRVTLTAVAIATAIGFPLGAFLAIKRFPTCRFWIGLLAALMGFPPVVAGLVVYLFLSASGLFGPLELLFTPTAMIIVQVSLVFPIIATLTQQAIYDLYVDHADQLCAWRCSTLQSVQTLLWEGRFSLLTAVLAGFGRAVAEVGGSLDCRWQYQPCDTSYDDHDCTRN